MIVAESDIFAAYNGGMEAYMNQYPSDTELISMARKARKNAYAPYSHHTVGAAVLAEDGTVYTGCNVESATYTPTICAERNAIFHAVAEGRRSFICIAIVGGPDRIPEPDYPCPPCGVCRQVMQEFCKPDSFRIIMPEKNGQTVSYLLKELLPLGFDMGFL